MQCRTQVLSRKRLVFIEHSAKTPETPIETEGKESTVELTDQQGVNSHRSNARSDIVSNPSLPLTFQTHLCVWAPLML